MPPCLLFLAASKYCSAQACQTHWGSTCWKLIQCLGFIWEQQKFEKTCLILAYCKETKWNTLTGAVFCILVYFWGNFCWFCHTVLTFIRRTKSYTLQWLQGPDFPSIKGDFYRKNRPDRPFDCYNMKLNNIHIYCEYFLRGLSPVFRAPVTCPFFHLEVLSHWALSWESRLAQQKIIDVK